MSFDSQEEEDSLEHTLLVWEKAAKILSENEPPIVLAKVDAHDAQNKDLATKHGLSGFPTIKILKDGGNVIGDYKGPRDADGIVPYVIKQTGPPSLEITLTQEGIALVEDYGFAIMGIFPEFSGEEYDNFTVLAERLRSGINFGHTKDSKLLPIVGDLSSSANNGNIKGPFVRLYKPFDEFFEDFQEFDVDVLEKLIEVSSAPLVTYADMGHYYVRNFFHSPHAKALLYVNYTSDNYDALKATYYDVAKQYKGKGVSFFMGVVEAGERMFESLQIKVDQVPILIIEEKGFDRRKYLKPKVLPEQILSFVNDYKNEKLQPYWKSEPIPEVNDGLIKVLVRDNFQDIVFNSGKNVLLEFTSSRSLKRDKFGSILEEIAASFRHDGDDEIMIARLDSDKNDAPTENFEFIPFATLYFASASGRVLPYKGDNTKEDIIDFIQKNRDTMPLNDSSSKDEL
ncbi:chaperone [Lithospermum erythrorhizon]|uniref:protein disulfide-isomerase n=1 Tax=Lithospermum erythrorhizon TaxID=34254 RepID=A0AAV3QFP4_LITER